MATKKKEKTKYSGKESFLEIIQKATNNPFVHAGTDDISDPDDFISTGNIVLDYQISARGGIPNNRTTEFVGEFHTGKTFICAKIAKNAIRGNTSAKRKYKVLWMEGEGATSKRDLLGMGFTEKDLVEWTWIPAITVEDGKSQIVKILDLKKDGIIKDNIIIIVDSIGGLGSQKELNDVREDKDKSDMTRAKALKSLFRLVTNYAALLKVPIIYINHVWKSMDMFAQTNVGGGQGPTMAPSYIVELNKAMMEKTIKGKKQVVGNFVGSKIMKARTAKYKSKVKIPLLFDKGIEWLGGVEEVYKDYGLGDVPDNENQIRKDLENLFKLGESGVEEEMKSYKNGKKNDG